MFARLLPSFLALLALGLGACGGEDGGSTGPIGPPPPDPTRILVLSDGGTEDAVIDILSTAGFAVDRGGSWWLDAGDSISDYAAVVLLTGKDYSHVMADSAQALLRDFAAAGGGLLVTEWFSYYSERNPLLASVLPVLDSSSYAYGAETCSPTTDHPITRRLPASFRTGPDWSWITLRPHPSPAKQATVVLTGSLGGSAMVAGRHGEGRVVSWGMAGVYRGDDIWTEAVELLLVDAVSWVAKE